MIYLKTFTLLDDVQEDLITRIDTKRIYNTYYPLNIFWPKDFKEISFDNITIFYGGNGSGKSTLLNIIADKLGAKRKSFLDKGSYFDLYVSYTDYDVAFESPREIKMITSDDVFDYLLDVRSINSHVNRQKDFLGKTYLDYKFNEKDDAITEYEQIKMKADANKRTMSNFIRNRLNNNNMQEYSNGESALLFWQREIKENSLYILDEPENSLSAENQIKLTNFILDSARFYNCQFIISTHSPFLLSIAYAKIYDLDEAPVRSKKWTELSNVKMYHDFFKEHENEFN